MRKAFWVAAVGTILVSSTALADGAAAPAAAPAASAAQTVKGTHGKYGAAGCGLGSIIISSGGIVQIFAATTNGTSANQTFAITSGTSNCDDSEGGSASTRVFVQANRVALAKDISRGSGETIAGLASIAGCADPQAVGAALQHNFSAIFPSATTSDEAVTDAIVNTLENDAALSCSALGG